MSESLVEKLRNLLIEKFNINPKEFRLHIPASTETWAMTFWPPSYRYHDYGISITAYKDGKLVVGSGPIYTNEGIREVLFAYKYERRLRKAKSEEEVKKIYEQAWEERKRIIEDFRQKKFEKHLKGAVRYFTRLFIWAEELAKRVSEEYGFEVKIDANSKTFFITAFDSTGMNDEQVVEEILKRVSAMVKVEAMLLNEDKMNEFLTSRGIEPWKPRRRRKSQRR
ncbi:MAG: hypothetical protein FGF48_06965 [Candidatus Brockarchaeota archaeon]|nr:hypothetical protein [Candidatus Brockarchaeota archaeon]